MGPLTPCTATLGVHRPACALLAVLFEPDAEINEDHPAERLFKELARTPEPPLNVTAHLGGEVRVSGLPRTRACIAALWRRGAGARCSRVKRRLRGTRTGHGQGGGWRGRSVMERLDVPVQDLRVQAQPSKSGHVGLGRIQARERESAGCRQPWSAFRSLERPHSLFALGHGHHGPRKLGRPCSEGALHIPTGLTRQLICDKRQSR